jgi:hypothetical protein
MPNQYIQERLAGIQTMLNGVHQAGRGLSSASRGDEREAFINGFLAQAFPSPYRFGSGDATDVAGNRSGQLDVVIEYPFSPSVPAGGKTKLFLAEGVAAVVEVKSDVAKQWSEVVCIAEQLARVKRQLERSGGLVLGKPPSPRIPLFVAGYTGWKQKETIRQNLASAAAVDGVLIVDSGLFVSPEYGVEGDGPWGLWGFICCLYKAISSLLGTVTDPLTYAVSP